MDGTRVSGVEFIRDGERLFAESRIETVLASGSIGSPTILQRSGIGDATRLAALGVTPQHALPGVGANLQDHLQLRSIYKVTGIRSRSEEHTSELQSLMRISYAVFCLKKKTTTPH